LADVGVEDVPPIDQPDLLDTPRTVTAEPYLPKIRARLEGVSRT
jgi:hypothetical protein